ncbi:hypothetical protein SAMN05660236_5252 [Ohtaekwangia koreensis]|uniref:Uncharacterized protein n=1 Tax=Ohtaekwangia koreensis TaxID=688867 RepID=A0A1T5MFV5_9BACT|nr:hypothetical protein SAMN05660236_5252 [Ohtaekwangia koreensis]
MEVANKYAIAKKCVFSTFRTVYYSELYSPLFNFVQHKKAWLYLPGYIKGKGHQYVTATIHWHP